MTLPQIDLSTVQGCQAELQTCARGLAWLDHLWGECIDSLSEAEAVMDAVEVEAAKAARQNCPDKATAAEIKAGMTAYVNARPSERKAADRLREARDTKEKIARWMRTAEKRMSGAQSALNGHQALGRYGGGSA